jgi:hypothetical protein
MMQFRNRYFGWIYGDHLVLCIENHFQDEIVFLPLLKE